MGWEFHNRRRKAENGHFIDLNVREQIHIRCSASEKEQIRAHAMAMGMDISEFMRLIALANLAQGAAANEDLAAIRNCVSTVRRAATPDVKGCVFDAARETLDVDTAV